MINESTPVPKKRLERIERASFEGFTPMTKEEVENLPANVHDELKAMGVIAALQADATSTDMAEVLKRDHDDGIHLVIAAVKSKDTRDFVGAVFQVENSKIVGRTRFGYSYFAGETIAQVLNTDTYAHHREGLGEERLRISNDYTKKNFGLKLSSYGVTGVERSSEADGLWKKLLAAGLAEERKLRGDAKMYSML